MNKFKKVKIFAATLLLSITLSSSTAFAAKYTVIKNDSLYTIGNLFNTSINTIKTKNNLKSDVIYPDQVLNIPAKKHTIEKGDTLFLIAKKYNISLSSLRKANNKWDDLLIPGKKLVLPATKANSKTAKTVISYTKDEVDLLARLITAEAMGEPYEAQVAVGGVVVNRVQSTEWPSTITDVIYHVSGGYHQFTPVKNGFINNPPTDDAIKAAWAALHGSDPSNGAIFYFDDSCTNEWLWSKPMTARIGKIVFVK